MACQHSHLYLNCSPFAELAGYEQPDKKRRTAAETKLDRCANPPGRSLTLFPAPLVLPHDDLNYDPDQETQRFKQWWKEPARNKMTDKKRNKIYIANLPEYSKEMEVMRSWTVPEGYAPKLGNPTSPDIKYFINYLKAFYHGIDVEILPNQLKWVPWTKTKMPADKKKLPRYIGLEDNKQAITRIRVREVPDKTFPAQLNLDDILDTAISILPEDAYAILLLVDHDIYENKDDDFCCGRAYGGSRVAVVQTARYNPFLDQQVGIDTEHMWPLSHCKAFIDELCAVEDVEPSVVTKEQEQWNKEQGMRATVDAARGQKPSKNWVPTEQALWFSRLARTISHELGHCFAMAHCVYYACNMQSTASMKEDVRQPPYLCPVDEAKLAHAIVEEFYGGDDRDRFVWMHQRRVMLSKFCEHLPEDLLSPMWTGYAAWLRESWGRGKAPILGTELFPYSLIK